MTGQRDGDPATEPAVEPAVEPAAAALGIEVAEATADRVVGSLPAVAGRAGAGGAAAVLADTLARAGASVHAGPGRVAVTVDLNATLHTAGEPTAAPAEGRVTGVATPVHRGRSMATYRVTVTDVRGRRVGTARVTCLLREP